MTSLTQSAADCRIGFASTSECITGLYDPYNTCKIHCFVTANERIVYLLYIYTSRCLCFGGENNLSRCIIHLLVLSLLLPFRQGYAEDYPRPNHSAYEDYYANYYKYMGKYMDKHYYNSCLYFWIYTMVCEMG